METQRGRTADAPGEIPASGWKDVALRTWRSASDDNVGLIAAGVAFYSFLALVPLLAATVLVYGLVANMQTVSEHAARLTAVLPSDVAPLITEQLVSVVTTSDGKKGVGLLIALVIALFGARNAVGSIVTALNIAYGERETRGFLKVNLLALALTAGGVATVALGLVGIGAMRFMGSMLPATSPVVVALTKVVTYALLALAAAGAATLLYRYGPARDHARWSWITPGATLFAVGWVALTVGFGFYAANFGSYGATYGSLSAVVVLLTWIYLSAYALLFGAELNAELEHQTARDTTIGPDEPMGERDAWAADHVAGAEAAAPA